MSIAYCSTIRDGATVHVATITAGALQGMHKQK
jgi:hypothetical protein